MSRSKDVTAPLEIDVSRLSLMDRARLSALAELDGDPEVRARVLGLLGEGRAAPARRRATRELPPRWTQIHVLDRIEEAYEVLASMPMATRPKAYGNAMPTPFQQKLSIYDQIEMIGSGELEKLHEERNRVRLTPTAAQVTRMDQALGWPFEYLGDQPEQARALSLRCLWSVMKADIRKRCEQRGIDHPEFNAQWQQALALVTGSLQSRKVPVS
jgi:hypothetical protein